MITMLKVHGVPGVGHVWVEIWKRGGKEEIACLETEETTGNYPKAEGLVCLG